MRSERRLARLEYVLGHRQPDLTIVIENVHDPHNVSAMLRSCDAAGVAEVQLVYTTEKFPKVGKKSSASAGKWVDRRTFNSIEECYRRLRNEGFKIYATQLADNAVPLYDLDLAEKVGIVFGNEHRGVSDEAARLADGIVQIPMFGMIQSLNVSVACAITLYEALRQRLTEKQYDRPKYTEKELRRLMGGWAKK